MADSLNEERNEQLFPAVVMYGPTAVGEVKAGEVKYWCACGLSKKQPWCDDSHKGTGFQPVKWTVPVDQSFYEICLCKHTRSPLYCDGTHTNLPSEVIKRIEGCEKKKGHNTNCRLCTSCGWLPDF